MFLRARNAGIRRTAAGTRVAAEYSISMIGNVGELFDYRYSQIWYRTLVSFQALRTTVRINGLNRAAISRVPVL